MTMPMSRRRWRTASGSRSMHLLTANPPPTRFNDAADVLFDATIPYDIRFFESLHRIVQSQPWLERDKALIDPLKSLGIEEGKPFAPDGKTRTALTEGA